MNFFKNQLPIKVQSKPDDQLVVLIDAPLPTAQAERIRRIAPGIELLEGASKAALKKARVVYTNGAAFDPADMPNLRWIQVNTVAVNHLVGTPIADSGVAIANVRGAYSMAVAECAVAMLLALTRRMKACHSLQLQGKWPEDVSPLAGENCHGKTMGIVGYGSIGRHIARIAQAIGMKVIACKRQLATKQESGVFRLPNTGDPEGSIPQAWFSIEQIDQMLTLCDAAVITLPLTDATRGLIGRNELDALPSRAYLLVVGRGGVVDEVALIQRLLAGRIAGAGLDVFATEPLEAESPFWTLPNVIVMPHIASWTKDQALLAGEVLIENISRYVTDRPLINLVDLKQGY